MESPELRFASKTSAQEIPSVSSTETPESLGVQLEKYESAIRSIEEQLADYNDLVEGAEYLSHDKEGHPILGVKALEYDLERATTKSEHEKLSADLRNARRNLDQAIQAYDTYWKSIKDRLTHLKSEAKRLRDRLKIEEHKSALEKKIDALEVNEKDLEHYTLAPEEARKIIEALQAHLFESKVVFFQKSAKRLVKRDVSRWSDINKIPPQR